MTKDLRADLQRLAESMVGELESLVERHAVQLVADRLGTRVPSSVARGRKVTRPRAKSAKAGRAPKGDNAARILDYVKSHQGERSERVRAALGLGRGQWIYALNGLIARKAIRRRGVKRASTLHLK